MDQISKFLVFINDNIVSEENIFTAQYCIPLKFGSAYPLSTDLNHVNNNMGRIYHYKLVFLKDPKTGYYDLLDRNALRAGVFIMPTVTAAAPLNPGQSTPNSLKVGFGIQANMGNLQFGISNFGISTQLQ